VSKNSPRPAPQRLARENPSTSERAAHNRDRRLRRKLLAWWDAGHNDLPWRGRADSYGIWISEAMAQQTRLAVVAPAWERFLKRFPDIESLATADEDEVLSLWSGLGYYSRARSLHRAAQTLHAAGASSFPDTWEEARALPGVGDYTAAAVLSISHQRPYAAVDGNVTRVLSRLDRLGPADNKREPYAGRAQALLDKKRPGDWNEALMELGETHCRPRNPDCAPCPWRNECCAFEADVIDQHPPPKPRRAPTREGIELRLVRDSDHRILLQKGVFRALPHLWLPPIASLPGLPARGDFRHAIVHRIFEVHVRTQEVSRRALQGELRKAPTSGERKIFDPDQLATIGRSSLLTKSLRQAGWD
jgi:A/G-specific adenine glycosylase